MSDSEPFPVFDGHVDLIYHLQQRFPLQTFNALDHGQLTPVTLRQGGVRLLCSAFYCADTFNGPHLALSHLRRLLDHADRCLDGFQRVADPQTLESCWQGNGPVGLINLLENADALLELGSKTAWEWGFRVVGLTHAGRNRLADGNSVANPGGLTAAGKKLLSELEQCGMVIDLAHLAEPGFWEVLERSSAPLIASHTGLRPFADLPRNLSSAQLQALLERGGMVGLTVAPEMLKVQGSVSLEDLFRQLDWLLQSFGSAGVALGSDFGGFEGEITGLGDHGGLPVLAERLLYAGYDEATVAAVLGENWRRFYSTCWSNSTQDDPEP